MAGPPQQEPRQSRLAIHNRQRPRQAEETVPSVRVTRATSMSIVIRASREKSLRDCSHVFGFAFRESFCDAWYLSFVIPGGCGDPALFRTRRLSHLSGHWSCCELHCQVDETDPPNLPSINSCRAQIAFQPLSECPLIP
jgi:hypothetical protein